MPASDYDANLVHVAAIDGFAEAHEPRSIEAGDFGRLLVDIYHWTDIRLDVLYSLRGEAFRDEPAQNECHELVVLRGRVHVEIDGLEAPLSELDAKVIRVPAGTPYAIRNMQERPAILLRYRHPRSAACDAWQPGRLRQFDRWKDHIGLAGVARRHADDRGRRFGDVFHSERGDVNVTWAYPGVITAWHAHQMQDDNWFVAAGALKVGLAKAEAETFSYRFVHQSEFEAVALRIPTGVLHGWRNFTGEEAILIYYITTKYDPANPDELRFSIDAVGADWSTPVK